MEAGVLKPTPRKLIVRGAAFLAGVYVLYHEVVVVESAEPLLVLLGLWAMGVPPALFLDGLRKVTEAANSAVDDVTGAVENAVSGRRRDDPPEIEERSQ